MEYPAIVKADHGGLKVLMTRGSSLPGIYTNYHVAEQAIARVLALQLRARSKQKGNK